MAVAGLTMVVAFSLVPQPTWLLSVAASYLAMAALVPRALDIAAAARRKVWVRLVVMLVDVGVVSAFLYHWGARTSPVAFMYVPIVSGWTLIPQRHLGRAAGATVLLAYGTLLWLEQLGWSARPAPLSTLAAHSSAGSAVVYFVLLACAIVAVHGLVDFTVVRLREHSLVVSRLSAENRTRERESQLAVQLEEAQRLEALGRLAGGVAHDFNNLLTVLMGCAELAEMQLHKNPLATARALRELQTAAERGASLTAQLLDFASRRPAKPRNVDLNRAVGSAGKLLERLLEARVELSVVTQPEPCVVHVDPSGLERLLLNLAVNARDAMPDGGKLRLSTRVEHVDDVELAVLEVSDTGTGIASKDLPHIFEPFFTTKARGKGTGLGLASVYGIVKQSQGQIEVESQENAGTTFRVRWPRVSGSVVESVEPRSAASGSGELILLVDDDAEVRSVALAHLEGAGYAVLTAESGEHALAVLEQRRGDIRMLVSDVSMPGISGVELARRVHEQLPTVPILLISGYSEELHARSQRLGRFLPKPFSGQRLLSEVRQALDGSAGAS
jgi:signal transduction histidine kinase